MNRSDRLEPVQRVTNETERQHAQRVANCEQQLAAAEAKLAELEKYHADYAKEFAARAGAGMEGTSVRDYQAFLARLVAAVKAQQQVVERSRAERAAEKIAWQRAATRSMAVTQVIERWQQVERREVERREQIETDERAQRPANATRD